MHVDQREFELQVWNGKEYEPVATGRPDELQGRFAAGYGPRRIVDKAKNRPLKPRYRVPPGSRGGRGAHTIIGEYMAWAIKKGLKQVHVFGDPRAFVPYAGIEFIGVRVEDFLGPAPAPEVDE